MGPELSFEKLYGYTEPIRRLIQREETTPQANEIPNTMPSWLPGDDYLINFRKGDPLSKIDQGYARLPGAGYAALHPELKNTKPENYPDIYRLSILADVAPYSREYNIYRQAVAQKAPNNTQLRIEYEKILERVKETKESAIKMANRHFTAPTEEIQGTVASVSPAGITLREFPGRVFQYSSVGLSAADMSARVLGENKTRVLRPWPQQKPRAPTREAGLPTVEIRSEQSPTFLCRLFPLSLFRRRVFALSLFARPGCPYYRPSSAVTASLCSPAHAHSSWDVAGGIAEPPICCRLSRLVHRRSEVPIDR